MSIDEIIAALEQATGPDRDLDVDIYAAANPALIPVKGRDGIFVNDARFLAGAEKYHIAGVTSMAPSYTASIDASLTLVPNGNRWAVEVLENISPRAWCSKGFIGHRPQAVGATPALALCISALRARQSLAVKGSR